MVLSKMKTIAERQLSDKVTEAVMAVSAHFTIGQGLAMKEAAVIGRLSGLPLLSTLILGSLHELFGLFRLSASPRSACCRAR
jgi:hypothetical protein